MSTHQIHVFISHSWKYSNHYDTLSSWIFEGNWSVGQASLDFRDFSVPKDDPIHNPKNTAELQRAIYNQISKSHVIVIPTGMYANYSQWIQKEIDGSKIYSKPILAVNPWGQERASSVVKANSKKYVGWNKEPLIQAIWDLYRSN
jgi:hypothetical protein